MTLFGERRMLKKMRELCVGIALFVFVMFGSKTAQAQQVEADALAHKVGGWNLVEIKDTTGAVMGFWGIPTVPVEVGNIRRLWFEATTNDDWNVWAFEPIAISAKAGSLILNGASYDSIQFVMHQEFLAESTAFDLDINGGVEGLVVKGFIEGDPLVEAAGSLEDPDPMIDLLADIGYPIAPEMTDLLVDGTAGASVGMNPATKQTLDCLRSFSSSCGGCICTLHDGLIHATAWTVFRTLNDNDNPTAFFCQYQRTETRGWWKTGENAEDCTDCTEGSEDNPILYQRIVEPPLETWPLEYPNQPCPDEPFTQ